MNEVLALAVKDLRLLLRDKAGFIFSFCFPLVYAVFFGAIFSGMGGTPSNKLQVSVVDEDGTPESRAFVESLVKVKEVEITEVSEEEAVQSVRRGKRLAYVVVPEGFGANRDGMFWGDPPQVIVGIDPSRQAEAAMLQGVLVKCSFDRIQEMFRDPSLLSQRIDDLLVQIREADGVDPMWRGTLELFLPAMKAMLASRSGANSSSGPESGSDSVSVDETEVKQEGLFGGAWLPVEIETEPVTRQKRQQVNSYSWSFPQGIIWGVMACSASFGISFVVERTSGTLVRLRMAPVRRWQILAGKATACFVTTVAMMLFLLLLAAFVFKVRPHSVGLLAVATVSVALAFVGIMMLLSVLGKTEQSAGGIGWAVLLVMAMIGGGMVPRIFMPSWMQSISHISPVKWAIHALEGALWRGFSPGEMMVPCAVLVGIGVVCFACGVRAFKWMG